MEQHRKLSLVRNPTSLGYGEKYRETILQESAAGIEHLHRFSGSLYPYIGIWRQEANHERRLDLPTGRFIPG